MVCIRNFGLDPKSIGKPLQVFKQMVCVYALNLKGSLLTTVFVKLVNSRSWKEYMIREEKKGIDDRGSVYLSGDQIKVVMETRSK